VSFGGIRGEEVRVLAPNQNQAHVVSVGPAKPVNQIELRYLRQAALLAFGDSEG